MGRARKLGLGSGSGRGSGGHLSVERNVVCGGARVERGDEREADAAFAVAAVNLRATERRRSKGVFVVVN